MAACCLSSSWWRSLAIGLATAVGTPYLVLTGRARHDYQAARGTQHRRQLEAALVALRRQREQLRAEGERRQRRLAEWDAAERAELERTLAAHLIETRLDGVAGVGPTRATAIRTDVFRGRLDDLRQAHLASGIGPTTQQAIDTWLDEMKRDWHNLLATPYPSGEPVRARYAALRAALADEKRAAAEREAQLAEVEGPVAAELDRLRLVSVADFRRALAAEGKETKDGAARQAAIAAYVVGSFPPWAAPPAWYATLERVVAGAEPGG